MQKPVDIYIPYWGDIDLAREAVESVLAQKNPNWQLTVVDDAYPDESFGEYVMSISDPRVHYERLIENIGITANFRHCIQSAKHDLVCVLGCDDRLLPNYVDVVSRAHNEFPDAAIIQPGVRVIDDSGEASQPLADRIKAKVARPKVSETTELHGEALAASLLRGNWMYWPSLTFKSQIAKEFDFRDEFPITQDLALVMDMILAGHSLVLEPELAFEYRRHSSSASMEALSGRRFADDRRYAALAAKLTTEKGWSTAAKAARMRILGRAHALSELPSALASRNGKAAKALLLHAFKR